MATDNTDKDSEPITSWGPYMVPDGRIRGAEPSTVEMYVKFVGPIDVAKLRSFHTAGGSPEVWTSSPEIKAVTIITSKSFDGANMIQAGANKFFQKPTTKVPLRPKSHNTSRDGRCDSLHTVRGHFYTVKPALKGLLLSISATTGAFLKEQLVSDFLLDPNTIPDAKKKTRRNALSGVRVQMQYGRGKTPEDRQADMNNIEGRQKTIHSVSCKSISELIFKKVKTDPSSLISVRKYLEEGKAIRFT